MPPRPGGPLATRPLHFIWIADCSGSMQQDGKIQALNHAIREALPHMRQVATDNPFAQVLVRTVGFGTGAFWQQEQPTPVKEFGWTDLATGGVTSLGAALDLVAQALTVPPMEARALPPVLVLLSDGQPTDDYAAALQRLLALPWGQRAVRLAIALGKDADREVLREFVANPQVPVLEAHNPEQLVRFIRWASTAVLQAVSAPGTRMGVLAPASVLPVPPSPSPGATGVDVW